MRDHKAIARLAEGYLKLLFPDLKVSDEEFTEYCVNPAVRMRQQIRDELTKIDPEYTWVSIRSSQPDEFQQLHPAHRPEPEAVAAPRMPTNASPPRPEPRTIELRDGQTGVSYRRLFDPYLRGARSVTLVDPYVRFDYQIHNFINFLEVLQPESDGMELNLVTAAGSDEEEVELSAKLDQVMESAAEKQIKLQYRFDRLKHDRMIETDTGWHISLGRGLDIFHRADGRFSLGFVDQTQRKCKETCIIVTRRHAERF